MTKPKPYRIEAVSAYALEGLLARLPERCERLVRITATTTLTEEDLEMLRREGNTATPLPAEASFDEMNEAARQIAASLNAAAGKDHWTARQAQSLSRHTRQMLERLVTGHYAAPTLSEEQPAKVSGPQMSEAELRGLLTSYGLTPEDLLGQHEP